MSEPKPTTEMSPGSSIGSCPKRGEIIYPISCTLCEEFECRHTAEDCERMCENECSQRSRKQSRIK